ncbi:MAG: hypothetical protein CVV44_05440 [Spirochaetae bacterium HGW-Spirochaetae-1]|jgi:hypothetical protein|nr:MAG: hypothetical protein CVV44_05440 [Spirochaetae bacterium HGW-Spirochaetae-1]
MIKTAKMGVIFLLFLGILQGCLGERLNPQDPKGRHYQSTGNDPVDNDPLKVAAPVITPEEDVYNTEIEVTITCSTVDADIFYTLDGTEPSRDNGLRYTGSLAIIEEIIVRARAFKESMNDSDITEASYSFQVPNVTFSPAGGTYSSQRNVVLSTSVNETSIRFTTNGSQPGPTSLLYSSPVPVSQNTVIRALAYRNNWLASNTTQANYSFSTAAPIISPAPGTYDYDITITITAEEGATIYYTIDGTTPTTGSPVYQNAITFSGDGSTMTVRAMAMKPNCNTSSVTASSFSINTAGYTGTTIIDHTCRDISQIPEEWITAAKNTLHIAYQHTSHGSQLISGMRTLEAFPSFNNFYAFSEDGSVGLHLDSYDPIIPGYHDLITDRDIDETGNTIWSTATRNYLNNPNNFHINVVMWGWCRISDDDNITTYIENMERLISEYGPGGINPRAIEHPVQFVFMNGCTRNWGPTGAPGRAAAQIREHCETNNRWYYDFYSMECYDPDGNYYDDNYVDDNLNYNGGSNNWAVEYLNRHPGELVNTLTMGDGGSFNGCTSCAHSEVYREATLNCVLKGEAAWHLWARLAGWDSN